MSVCTLRHSDPGGGYLEEFGIRVHYLGFGRFSVRNVNAIAGLVEQEQARVLHLHGYSAANFGRIAARRAHIPSIVHEHAVLRTLPHQYVADLLLRPLTDSAVAVSAGVRDFMVRARHIPPGKIRIVSNGVNTASFAARPAAQVLSTRQELRIADGAPVIGTVTRLRTEKGNEFLIRAIPHVLRERTDAVFLIIGDGPLRQDLERLSVELKIQGSVRFLGFRADVAALLSVLDVNVIPSLTEGFPLSLIEAMAAGNAIVASAVRGIRDVADDGRTALLVPPADPTALAQKISYLLTHRSTANALSRAAVERGREFDAARSAQQLRDVYSQLVGDR
jgi:glycosyltransferase involved in cell wall biosynthesis